MTDDYFQTQGIGTDARDLRRLRLVAGYNAAIDEDQKRRADHYWTGGHQDLDDLDWSPVVGSNAWRGVVAAFVLDFVLICAGVALAWLGTHREWW